MKDLPSAAFPPAGAADLEVSLLIPARHSGHALERTAREAHGYLSARFPEAFEIILIPNSPAPGSDDQSLSVAEALAKELPGVHVTPHDSPVGKGAGLRTGFLRSRGRHIFFTDADLPYDLGFFDAAYVRLRNGYDLVTGNRRVDDSEFDLPVSLLKLAYRRHRLGLLFNRVVRLLLPIRTIDTQAGIKAMSRDLATRAFGRQRCPGFFFDLELFLSARGEAMAVTELPVTLFLNTEKSTVRVFRESILAGYWLTRIAIGSRLGRYGRPPKRKAVPSRFGRTSFGTRFFLTLRWALTPYSRMAARLPDSGLVLDLGCGHGLFALAAADNHPARRVLGIDHDVERIRLAKLAAEGSRNLQFETGGMTEALQKKPPGLAAVTLIDVMHYFAADFQESLFRAIFAALPPGGRVLVREVDPEAGFISAWNRLYEKIATATGFTQAEKAGLHFRTQSGWIRALEDAGFRVRAESCSSPLFADVLYVGDKPGEPV